jgi:tyrosine-specific transport protein
MYKKLGAISLVAGTCIGSGMIALPIVLAKIGIIASIGLMFFMWFFMYYSSLINLELNLQAGQGLALGELGQKFSGFGAKLLGNVSLKLLSYSLLSVYIYGGASVLSKILGLSDPKSLIHLYAFFGFLVLLMPIKQTDRINRVLFIFLLAVFFILIFGLLLKTDLKTLFSYSNINLKLEDVSNVIPVIFTSFGFQVIFHTLTNHCKNDAKILKQVFFWGSLIPALVYVIWTCTALFFVHINDNDFYQKIILGQVDVGEFVAKLSAISQWSITNYLIFYLSFLAVTTSFIGVGIGLFDSIDHKIQGICKSNFVKKNLSALLTVIPAYLVAYLIPNAFIKVLGFAGMILAVIAIILPCYLLFKANFKNLYYKESGNKILLLLCILLAFVVIFSELYNLC